MSEQVAEFPPFPSFQKKLILFFPYNNVASIPQQTNMFQSDADIEADFIASITPSFWTHQKKMNTATLHELQRRAEFPTHRGRLMTSRKVLNLEEPYFWKDSPTLHRIPRGLPDCDETKWNIGLVNCYESQKSISSHTDTSDGMVTSSGVYSVSYGLDADGRRVKTGTVIGTFWLGEEKLEIKSGVPMIFDGYTIPHRASTKKGFTRINITLREKIWDGSL